MTLANIDTTFSTSQIEGGTTGSFDILEVAAGQTFGLFSQNAPVSRTGQLSTSTSIGASVEAITATSVGARLF